MPDYVQYQALKSEAERLYVNENKTYREIFELISTNGRPSVKTIEGWGNAGGWVKKRLDLIQDNQSIEAKTIRLIKETLDEILKIPALDRTPGDIDKLVKLNAILAKTRGQIDMPKSVINTFSELIPWLQNNDQSELADQIIEIIDPFSQYIWEQYG